MNSGLARSGTIPLDGVTTLVLPTVGDIGKILADPAAVSDVVGEWIELNASTVAIDLAGFDCDSNVIGSSSLWARVVLGRRRRHRWGGQQGILKPYW